MQIQKNNNISFQSLSLKNPKKVVQKIGTDSAKMLLENEKLNSLAKDYDVIIKKINPSLKFNKRSKEGINYFNNALSMVVSVLKKDSSKKIIPDTEIKTSELVHVRKLFRPKEEKKIYNSPEGIQRKLVKLFDEPLSNAIDSITQKIAKNKADEDFLSNI